MQTCYVRAINALTGAALPGAAITVYVAGTTTLATIYSTTGGAIANPATADSDGQLFFKAANGLYDVKWAQGSYASPTIVQVQLCDLSGYTTSSARIVAGSQVIMRFDPSLGSDGPGQGLGWGAAACATAQGAYANLCNNYDHGGYSPIIQCAGPTSAGGSVSARTFNQTLNIVQQANAGTLLNALGLYVDGGGSNWIGPGDACIFARCFPGEIHVRNANMSVTGSGGYLNCIHAYGSDVQLEGGLHFGVTGSLYGALFARNGGHIATVPGLATLSIEGSGGYFAGVANGGQIEFEGCTIDISTSGISFPLGVFNVSGLDCSISLSGMCFIGSNNVSGPQAQIQKGGLFDTWAQTGGQTITLPSPLSSTTSNNYKASPFSNGLQNGYLPGSTPVEISGWGGRWTDMPKPVITQNSGCGSNASVLGAEPAIRMTFGSSAPTSGSQTATLTLSSASAWTNVTPTPRSPGAVTGFNYSYVGPVGGTTPGYLVMYWTGTSNSPGTIIDINCSM